MRTRKNDNSNGKWKESSEKKKRKDNMLKMDEKKI